MLDSVINYLEKCPYLKDIKKYSIDVFEYQLNTLGIALNELSLINVTIEGDKLYKLDLNIKICLKIETKDYELMKINNDLLFNFLRWNEENKVKDIKPILPEGCDCSSIDFENMFLYDTKNEIGLYNLTAILKYWESNKGGIL